MKNVLVIGGGNIAHSLCAMISLFQRVTCLTRKPNEWKHALNFTCGDTAHTSNFEISSTNDYAAIANADIIFVALPRFAVNETIEKAKPYFRSGQILCFVPGVPQIEDLSRELRPKAVICTALQRVPYISRISVYGSSVSFSPERAEHKLLVTKEDSTTETFFSALEWMKKLFTSPISLVYTFLPLLLNNSNPLLHPSRLVVLFRDWKPGIFYPHMIKFYKEWTKESSEIYIAADEELLEIVKCFPEIRIGSDFVPVLEHYECKDADELTAKITSIKAFENIDSPMLQTADGFIPDLQSRYFTEDVPFGTVLIQQFAKNTISRPP